MITVLISYTGKSPNPNENWRCFGENKKHFDDMTQAKEWIKEEYYYCKKKVPMYCDTKQGEVKCGYIYCYKEKDYNRKTGKLCTYYRQDWVSFYNVERTAIAV